MKTERSMLVQGMRGYLIDCHRNNLEEVSFEGFNGEQYRSLIHKANIDNLMIYAKDHWGFAYYPSKIGPIHPKLKNIGLDFTGEVKAIAEEEGVSVCLYYSIDTDHMAAKMHPKWRAVDTYGKEVRAGNRWFRCAITHEYGEYALKQIEEILQRYQPDGMFFDCFPSVLCFCNKCQARYREVMGRNMPIGDEVNKRWRELHTYEEMHYWLPYMKRLREVFDRVSPGTSLTTNGGNANMPKSIRKFLDYHFAEPWAGNYLSSGFSRDTMVSPQIGPGNLGFIYDVVPVEFIQKELLSIGMQGSRPFLYSESMMNNGSLEEHELERIGDAYKVIKAVEEYWKHSEFLTSVDIFYSDTSHVFAPERNTYNQDWWARGSKHLNDVQAAMALVASLHQGYRIVQGDSLDGEELSQQNLMIIPNARVIPEASWRGLIEYVKTGGKLIICMDGPPVDKEGKVLLHGVWEELLGCEMIGQDNRYIQNGISNYVKFSKAAPLSEEFKKFPLGVVGPRLIVKNKTADIWGDFVAPIFEVDFGAERWMAWRPPNPSPDRIIGPAVLRNSVGRGEVILLNFDIFEMARSSLAMETGLAIQESHDWHWPSLLLKNLILGLSRPEIYVGGIPENIYVSFRQRGHDIFIHILNGQYRTGTVYSGEVVLNCELSKSTVKSLVIYPEVRDLPIKIDGEAVRIPVSISHLYTIAKVEMIR